MDLCQVGITNIFVEPHVHEGKQVQSLNLIRMVAHKTNSMIFMNWVFTKGDKIPHYSSYKFRGSKALTSSHWSR